MTNLYHEAYLKGREDFYNYSYNNPYRPGSQEYDEYDNGYNDAFSDE